MPIADPDLRRTWLFGPGADTNAHNAMLHSGGDVLMVDLEDFTPPTRRDEARRGLAALLERWRDSGRIAAVRINALDGDGPADLAAAMPARPDVVAYPMAESAAQMQALHAALTHVPLRSSRSSRPHGRAAKNGCSSTACGWKCRPIATRSASSSAPDG